ncbi:hypothetical protein [uncultured Agitococcus sp.]|uniref:hypothetical protein n=1 Tax=uncultured Agitococcus sp. TaxID=1506599 RepID=UPI002606F33F|nr:hypothetical protein [uncultured Agitococcus sp.]
MFPLGVLKKKIDLATLINLRFEGSEGSQVFTDSSPYHRSVTVSSGSPALTTTNPLSGTSSLLLTTDTSQAKITTNDTLNPANRALKSIEFRVQIDLDKIANNESQLIFTQGITGTVGSVFCYIGRSATGNGGSVVLVWYNLIFNQIYTQLGTALSDLSQNNHVCFDLRNNGVLFGFSNGMESSTSNYQYNGAFTNSLNLGGTFLDIGNYPFTPLLNQFRGKLDNFKFSNVGRYLTNFTPPV